MDRGTRVIVGVSGTLSGLAALYRAVDEARERNALLVPLVAWEPSQSDGLRPLSELEHAASRRMDTAFEQTFAGYPEGIRIHPVVVRGDAGPALVAAADRPDDLLVVGAGGHRRLQHVLHGSVTRHCKAHARCRVVVASPSRLLEHLALPNRNGGPLPFLAGDRNTAVPRGMADAGNTN
ncbi:universal stress protein [Kitasatospora sp. NPDC002040]|uniref:universal stress protein n=1 Tax=Kitasatospora sp. NPDC002040 TaxID=3154661 RepID=UPI0033191DDE